MRWCSMRKFGLGMVVLVFCLICLPFNLAQAAAKINLAIDGVIVPAERTAENTTNFYLEARPQLRSNSVFVPVLVASEILGADVIWDNPNINIKYEDVAINLTVGSRMADVDGRKITLPAAPYVNSGYTYVPIRFVAEAFNCDVEWSAKNNLVNIKTKPWELDGQQIIGVTWLENMTGYDMIYELNSPYFAQRFYQMTLLGLGEEVDAPADFGNLMAEQFADDAYNTTHYRLDKRIILMVNEDTYAWAMKYYYLDRGNAEHKGLININDKWYTLNPGLMSDLIALFQVTDASRLEGYKEYKAVWQRCY